MNTTEQPYLDIIQTILQNGTLCSNRTNVDTLSITGTISRYSLANNCLPIITTKLVSFKNIVHELLWMISGSTDAKQLSKHGVKIWDTNSSREFLDVYGFHNRQEGDIGPGYGFQWRHWGAKYIDATTDYSGQGIDQLANVIEKLRNDPNDRRIIMSAWNVSDLPLMVLPPCHCFVHFIAKNNELTCIMYQRSADVGLGVPYNITFYALLTHLIAQQVDMTAKELVHMTGDTHIYSTHIDALKQQLTRKPLPFPQIHIKPAENIDSYSFENFKLLNYTYHPSIQMPMAV
jgi:thymidylate synthase